MKFKSQTEYRITLMWGQKPNNTPCVCEKDYVWNPSTCACKISKYLKCIIGDSVVICKEIIGNKIYSNKIVFHQKLFQQKLFQQFLSKKM